MIDRHVEPLGSRTPDEPQLAMIENDIEIRRQDVHLIGLDRHEVGDLHDRHGGGFHQQLSEGAGEFGAKMLDDDEAHPGIHRQASEEHGDGLETAGRSSDSDDGERFLF